MQSICAANGFEQSQQSYLLYVSDSKAIAPYVNHDHRARILPVHTLSYSGYWLEGELSQVAMNVAKSLLRSQLGSALMGAVVPKHDISTLGLLRANSFELIGEFDWWTINLRSG